MAAPRRAAGPRALPLAVAALTFTQLSGWGMSFHVPAALYNQLSAGIGLSKAVVFGGVTLMLIVAALIAPLAGRLMDRDGARRWMTIGSLLIAGGLVVLSRADGLALYGLAWILFGLAMPFALNQGASTAIVQIAPDRARRAIAMLLVLIGFSPAIAWPTLLWLESLFGWRDALLVCATVHGVVCASLHFFCLPKGRVLADHPLVPSDAVEPRQAPVVARGTFALAATCFSAAGILSFGLPLHMIGLLQGYGHGAAEAVAIGALIGPGQVLARAFDMFGGSRFPILRVGLAATLLMPAALVVLLIWGQGGWGAMLFVFGYGVSAGLMSVVRAVAPIKLFGSAAYAVITGKLGLPQNMAFAAAPLGFALLLDHVGAPSVALASLAVAAICLASMVWLRRLAPSDGEA